jgi:hypothetical protein
MTDSVASDSSARDQFPYPGYDVLEGERDIGRIDVEGQEHGLVGTIKRWLQGVLSDDADHARRYAEHLREGHFVLGVSVGEDEAAKQRAADALRGADAQFINYYAENYVEDLSASG